MKKYISPATTVIAFHAEDALMQLSKLPVNESGSNQNINNSDEIWTQKKHGNFGQSLWVDGEE